MDSLIGQISMEAFPDVGIAGFYYENPANDLSDDESFVQVRVCDDGSILSDDGENDDDCLLNDGENGDDDDRSHNDDDHDIRGNFYHLHDDEGNVDSRSQSDDGHASRGSICHVGSCVKSDESHGHNDDDHDLEMNDDGEENDRDDDLTGVNIDHGHCRQRA